MLPTETDQQPWQAVARARQRRRFDRMARLRTVVCDFAADARHAVQIFDVLAPQHCHDLAGWYDTAQATVVIDQRHGGHPMPQGQRGEAFGVGVFMSGMHDLAQAADALIRGGLEHCGQRHRAVQSLMAVEDINHVGELRPPGSQPRKHLAGCLVVVRGRDVGREEHGITRMVLRIARHGTNLLDRGYAGPCHAALTSAIIPHCGPRSVAKNETARSRARQRGVRRLRPGVRMIVKRAQEVACDGIVMGTHGRSAIANLVMGSVARASMHLARVPVTLVK